MSRNIIPQVFVDLLALVPNTIERWDGICDEVLLISGHLWKNRQRKHFAGRRFRFV